MMKLLLTHPLTKESIDVDEISFFKGLKGEWIFYGKLPLSYFFDENTLLELLLVVGDRQYQVGHVSLRQLKRHVHGVSGLEYLQKTLENLREEMKRRRESVKYLWSIGTIGGFAEAYPYVSEIKKVVDELNGKS